MVCCLGLRLCRWSGRSQIIKHQSVTYFLDGAHTPNSVKVCLVQGGSDNGHHRETHLFLNKYSLVLEVYNFMVWRYHGITLL